MDMNEVWPDIYNEGRVVFWVKAFQLELKPTRHLGGFRNQPLYEFSGDQNYIYSS